MTRTVPKLRRREHRHACEPVKDVTAASIGLGIGVSRDVVQLGHVRPQFIERRVDLAQGADRAAAFDVTAAVLDRHVVPDHEIAGAPVMLDDVLWPVDVGEQFVEQRCKGWREERIVE